MAAILKAWNSCEFHAFKFYQVLSAFAAMNLFWRLMNPKFKTSVNIKTVVGQRTENAVRENINNTAFGYIAYFVI